MGQLQSDQEKINQLKLEMCPKYMYALASRFE